MSQDLQGKKVLLAITGSIAAYKSAILCRLLIKSGADVKVIMTPAATKFISALTMATLSKHDVHTEVISNESWNNHVELGLWADVMLVAPCTATSLAKMANGIADNMVVACYLSAKCPVWVAPAMDLDMWLHGSTKRNLDLLRSYGNHIIPVGHGELASGLVGDGRMAEPEDIVTSLKSLFQKKNDIALERTVDIAATLGKAKSDKQIHIGFALETNDEMKNAQGKLARKNFDMVVLNSLRDKGAGFQGDTNKVTILKHNAEPVQYPLKSKRLVAVDIVDQLVSFL